MPQPGTQKKGVSMTGHEDALVFAYTFPAFGMPDTSPHFSRVKDYTLGKKNAICGRKNPK